MEVGSHNGTTGLALFEGMADDGVLTSVEPDPERLRMSKEAFLGAGIPHGRTRLIAADPHEVLTRLTDGHYDLFLSSDKPADHAAFAEQAARLLRPGGIAVFLNIADAADPAKARTWSTCRPAVHRSHAGRREVAGDAVSPC